MRTLTALLLLFATAPTCEAKKHKLGTLDYMLVGLGVFGGFLGTGASFVGHYREAQPCAAIDWPMRKYYIKKITDKSMNPSTTWKMLKLEICQRYDMAQQKFGNPAGQMAAAAMGSLGVAAPVCDIKPACREHMSKRCIWYGYIVFDAMIVHASTFFATCCFGTSGFLLMISAKPSMKFNAAMCGVIGICLAAGGIGYWFFDTYSMEDDMAKKTIWPRGAMKGSGFYVNSLGIFLMIVGTACGFISSIPPREKADDVPYDPMMAGGPAGGQPMGVY